MSRDLTRLLPIPIVGAAVAAYANSFGGVFLFDDLAHIVHNDRIHDLADIVRVLGGRRPLVDLSLALNYAFGGLENMSAYHAVNLAVHVLAALTLFGVVRRLLVKTTASGASACLAAAVATLWAVHPLLTQSVTYVIQRGESMMGLFYLLTVYCAVRAASTSHGRGWQVLCVLAGACGMASKAVMVTAPVMVLLIDRTLLAGGFVKALRRRPWMYAGLAGGWGVLWVCGVLPGVLDPSATHATVGLGFQGVSPLSYALTQPLVILHYLVLSVWPHPLVLDHNWSAIDGVVGALAPLIAMVVGAIAAVAALAKHRTAGVVAFGFFLILAPTSSVLPIRDVIFEHRMYLPLAMVITLLVVGGYFVLTRVAAAIGLRPSTRRTLATMTVVVATGVLTGATVARNRAYADPVTMWTDVASKRPTNARAFEHWGTALVMQGKKREAIAPYRAALRVDPAFVSVRENLANVLFETGDVDEAAQQYREVIRRDPNRAEARINLGHALRMMGRIDESIESFRAATRIDLRHATPRALAGAHFNLGSALAKKGDLDAALDAFREAVRIWPDYEKAHVALGRILYAMRHIDEAVEHFRRALAINPDNRQAERALAEALAARDATSKP